MRELGIQNYITSGKCKNELKLAHAEDLCFFSRIINQLCSSPEYLWHLSSADFKHVFRTKSNTYDRAFLRK